MANSSFAIWSNNNNIDIDLHINCWIFQNKRDVIDFGLMISNANKNDKVYFYIPFILNKNNIISLTESIQNNESLRAMIFNEQLSTSQLNDASPNCNFYTRANGKEFSFCLESYKYEENYEDGVRLTFSVNGDPKGKDTYFRFRLKDIGEESIFQRKERQVSSLTGIQEEYINVEININQFRKLSTSLQTSIHNSGDILNRVNMFLMADIDLTPVFSTHNDRPRTRILESADKWNSYIKIDENHRHLAYQYKKEQLQERIDGEIIRERIPFKSFTIFSKFEKTSTTDGFKLKAIGTLVLIGILSSLIVTGLLSFLESNELKEIKELKTNVIQEIQEIKTNLDEKSAQLLEVNSSLTNLQIDFNSSIKQIQLVQNNLEQIESKILMKKNNKTTIITKSEKH